MNEREKISIVENNFSIVIRRCNKKRWKIISYRCVIIYNGNILFCRYFLLILLLHIVY